MGNIYSLLEHFESLKKSLSEISVYDLNCYSAIELYYNIAKKFNTLVSELAEFEGVVTNELIEQSNTINELLNDKMTIEVYNRINDMVQSGMFENIISSVVQKYTDYFDDSFKPNVLGGNLWLAKTSTNDTVDSRLIPLYNTGCRGVLITAYHTFDSSSSTVNRDVTDSVIEYAIQKSKDLGFKEIIIKPHIWSSGSVNPTDINAFFSSWKQSVIFYATLSKKYNLSTMVIGNEMYLLSKSNYDKWVDLINNVRSLGLLTMYTCQGTDEFYNLCFKDNVDKIGLNLYPKIDDGNTKTLKECTRYIYQSEILQEVKNIKEYLGNRELYLSEFGCTRNLLAMNNPASSSFTTVEQSKEVQYKYYKAVMTVFAEIDLFKAMYFWVADTDGDINCFTPLGNTNIENLFKQYMIDEITN